MKQQIKAHAFVSLVQTKFFWLTLLTTLVLLAFFSLRVIQGHAEVKAGQMPKASVARQTFATTDGKKFNLEASRGKVMVVQFFGTWCGISKRQVSAINKLMESNTSQGLQVVGMSVKDPRSDSQAVKQFVLEQKVSYPVVSEVADKHFVDFVDSTNVSVPQTLIYGRDGRLAAHYVGFNPQVGTEIERKVQAELARQ